MNKVASPRQIELCKMAAIRRYQQHGIAPENGARLFDIQLQKIAAIDWKGMGDKAKEYGGRALEAANTPAGYAAGGALAGGAVGAIGDKENRGKRMAIGAGTGAALAGGGKYMAGTQTGKDLIAKLQGMMPQSAPAQT